jgi:hypothetical protein
MTQSPPSSSQASLPAAEEMIAAARSAAGLEDFGDPDPAISLRALVRSLNEESFLTPAGAQAKRASLVRVLANRLLLQHAVESTPAVAKERIRPPLVILGLPRSGTTKLHRMIAADPVMQKLPLWRLLYPVRALTHVTSDEDPRIAAARQFVEVMRQRTPDAYAAHPMDALEPDEEYFGMELSFLSHLNTSSFHAPAYERWLDGQSFQSWYTWLERLLQYVQHFEQGSGRPWVLKAPHHLGYLPLLFERFPGTTIVHCHRDPVTAVASFCALLRASRRSTSSRDDPHEVGRYVMRIYGGRMQRYLRDRAALEPHERFIDVPYREIVASTEDVIRRCYAAAGIELPESSLAEMRRWEARNEQHRHGRHSYELADFGLTTDAIASAFGDYQRRFAAFID